MLTFEVQAVDRERLQEDLQRLLRAVAGPGRVEAPHVVLGRCDPPPDPDLQAPVAEVVEHGDLLHQAQRVVEGQEVHERDQVDAAGALRGGGQEDAGTRRRVEGREVVLGLEVRPEAGVVEPFEVLQPLGVEPLQGLPALLHVIEDPEAHRTPGSD